MTEKMQAVRGMNDVLPIETPNWHYLEKAFSACLAAYGYQEIRFPIVENTSLFKRTIGEITDIVEKEMYTFCDLNGESLSLRPEGTAGCVRACLEHGLLYNQQQKLWYLGPMFRHERPQKGRYRQFTQLGVETFGIAGAHIELELIALCHRLWTTLGLSNEVQLEINSLGSLEERQQYKIILVDYFNKHLEQLDEDSIRRLDRNPMRILDSKNPEMRDVINGAPKLIDTLGEESRAHFHYFCQGLKTLGIDYVINPALVRGLDYYSHTVFEWVTTRLGSQATVCAGGRYDKLVEQLGGAPTSAVGFAIGVERLLLLLASLNLLPNKTEKKSLFIIPTHQEAMVGALVLAESIRSEHPHVEVAVNTAGGSYKSQFKKADKSGARFALILGENELAEGKISIKDLRNHTEQVTVEQGSILAFLHHYLEGIQEK